MCWISSENGSWGAWIVHFGSGNFGGNYKYNSCVVRAVSAFNPLQQSNLSLETNNKHLTFTEESAIKYLHQLGYTGKLTKEINI